MLNKIKFILIFLMTFFAITISNVSLTHAGDLSSIEISVYTGESLHVHLLLIDPQGNKTGFDPSINNIVDQIPNSIWGVDDFPGIQPTRFVGTGEPINGIYNLEVIGTNPTTYTLEIRIADSAGNSKVLVFNGSLTAGAIVKYKINFNNTTVALTTVSPDADNDGYFSDEDCNDNNPLEYPNQTWYQDTDNDGYSNGNTIVQCLRPTGYKTASELTATSGDCNDNSVAINPAATEVCDGVDNNCNGQIDEGVLNTYYQDADSDTYGNPNVTIQACIPPNGYVTNNTDCNDNDANIHPGGLPVRITGVTPLYFSSLQAAYDAAADGETIQSQAVVLIANLNINLSKTVVLEGGYNCDYTTITGETGLKGMLTVKSTSGLKIKNFILKK